MFVLVIGGTYGGKHKNSSESITNEEYRKAIDNDVPVFTLVDSAVLADHHLYQSNDSNPEIDRDKVKYPASDNIKIFHFINEVRKHSENNATHPFRNFLDIETYLKKQWAGMLFDFLSKSKNEKQSTVTNKLLSDLSLASRKTEELLKFVYGKLDEANAEEIINSVSKTVAAENFISLVLEMNKGQVLDSTTIERLTNTSMEEGWAQYLIDAADFVTTDEFNEGNHYLVIWPPSDNPMFGSGTGKVIKTFIDDEMMHTTNTEMENSFESLKSLDKQTQKKILSALLLPDFLQ